jgi:hypothetical protein
MLESYKLVDSLALVDSFKGYASPHARLTYMVKTGKLIAILRPRHNMK